MSEYTFRLVSTDNFDQQIARLNQFMARLREASAGAGGAGFNPASGNALIRGFEQVGERLRLQAGEVATSIGRTLEEGMVPDASMNTRLTRVYRSALEEIEGLIRTFAAESGGQIGTAAAVDLERIVAGVRGALTAQLNTFSLEARTALEPLIGRVQGATARNVVGNRGFEGAAATSGRNVGEILGTGTIPDERAVAAETAAAGAKLASQATLSAETLINDIVGGLERGITPTNAQLARLRSLGLATDIGRGVNAPIGFAGEHFQIRGEEVLGGAEIPHLQYARGQDQYTAALERSDAATKKAAADEEMLANLRRLQAEPGVDRLSKSLSSPYRDAAGRYYTSTGAPYTNEADIAQLNRQYAGVLQQRNRAGEVQLQQQQVANRSMLQAFSGGLFGHGFNPNGPAPISAREGLANLAGTAGVLLRYGATGVGINAAFTGLAEVKTQYLDLATAMANLQEIEQGLEGTTIDTNQAILAGIPAGEGAADAINTAAEAIARYGEEIRNGGNASEIATRTVRNVGQAMVLTGLDAKTAGEQLIDATQGFHLGSEGQQRVLDAVENARKNFGGNRSEIIQAVADSADLAANAGVDPEQLANIFALIQARTGASSSAVASAFERTISRAGTGQFQQALGSLGVANTGNIVDEITQISQKYHELDRTQQSYLISQLGGARQARELLPLLQEGDKLIQANERSYNGAGAAAEQYARQQATLAGQLRQIAGGLRDIALQAASSGLVDAFGATVYVLRPFIDGLDDALRLFNELPHPARTAAAAILEAAVAIRLFGSASTAAAFGNVFGRIPILGRAVTGIVGPRAAGEAAGKAAAGTTLEAGAEVAAGSIVTSGEVFAGEVTTAGEAIAASIARSGVVLSADLETAGTTLAAEIDAAMTEAAAILAEGAAVARAELAAGGAAAGAEQGLGAAGGALMGGLGRMLFNPVTGAIAGLIAIGGVVDSFRHLDAAAQQGAEALETVRGATSVQEFRTGQSQATAAALSERQGAGDTGGFFNQLFGHTAFALDWVSHGAHSTIVDRYAKDLRTAQYAKDEEARLASQESAGAVQAAARLFGTSGHDVSAGLQAMAEQGFTTTAQIRAVAAALGVLHVRAGSALGRLTGHAAEPPVGLLGNEPGIAAITGVATGAGPELHHESRWSRTLGGFIPGIGTDHQHGSIAPDEAAARQTVQDILDREGIGKHEVIPNGVQNEITKAVLDMYDFKGTAEQVDRYRTNTRRRILAGIRQLNDEAVRKGSGTIGNQELKTILEGDDKHPGWLQTLQGWQPPPGDASGGQGQLQLIVRGLKQLAQRSEHGRERQKLIEEIDQWEARLIQTKVTNLERLRHAEQARAGSPEEIAKLGQQYLNREVNAALDGGKSGEEALIGILDMANRAEIAIVLAALKRARDVAKHALDVVVAEEAALDAYFGSLPGPGSPDFGPGTPHPDVNQKRKAYHEANRRYKEAVDAAKQSSAPATGGDFETGGQAASDLENAHLAYLQSLAIPGNELQNAQIAIRVAQYQLSVADKNSADYWNAVKALHDAEYQYGQAQMQYANNLATLKIDITDPVAKARETLREAIRQLNFDRRRGAGPSVDAQDEVAVNQARADLRNTKFDQWLSDLRTAHDLGDIGDAAYIRALEHRLDGLRRIKDKTRADIDHINEIRQELKSAFDQSASQWNLGDIKVPTPYEVRRSLQGSGNAMSTTYIENRQTTISVNGADTAVVERTLRKILGPTAYRRATTTYRKS